MIPGFLENVDAPPCLDEQDVPLLKLLGCSRGCQVIEQARAAFASRSDECQMENEVKELNELIEAVGKCAIDDPNNIDNIIPKLK